MESILLSNYQSPNSNASYTKDAAIKSNQSINTFFDANIIEMKYAVVNQIILSSKSVSSNVTAMHKIDAFFYITVLSLTPLLFIIANNYSRSFSSVPQHS